MAETVVSGPRWNEVLRALRQARGTSQEAWAEILGYGRRTIQRWESGDLVPDAAQVGMLIEHCSERKLFRTYDRGLLTGLTITPETLREVVEEARLDPTAHWPAAHEAQRNAPALPHNLPTLLSSFIGREREVAAAGEVLITSRLLTLTGAGGAGKTRLALEIARIMRERYPNGVWLVELAPLSDPDSAVLLQAVASALGVREVPGRPLMQTLLDQLRPRRLLLLLDNCEHLVDACAQLTDELLRGCPLVTILATSREALRLTGEIAWRVPSLSLPDAVAPLGPAPDLTALGQFDAVRLFVERAQAAVSTFQLTEQNAPAVIQVCRRLDGIPLALELAAARVRALSVHQIAARLDDRFRLLTSGSRTAPPRHQTLSAALDWSHALLSEQEQALFRRLAVFAGGFGLEAAEQVCAGAAIGRHDVLDLLVQLVEKSLVQAEEQGEESRYRLLETVRQYAGDKLAAAGEAMVVRERHRDWLLGLVERTQQALSGPQQQAWLSRLETEHDNLRTAMGWSLETGKATTALQIAGAVWRFWLLHGHLTEGRTWIERALANGALAPPPVLAAAARAAGNLATVQGDYAAAEARYEESLAAYRRLGDREGIAALLNNLGISAMARSDYARARALHEESLALRQELGDTGGVAASLDNLGMTAEHLGEHVWARALHEESLALRRKLGDAGGVATSLDNLGIIARALGDYATARAHHEESLALRRELGERLGTAASLENLGLVMTCLGDYATARALHAESLLIRREVGDKAGIAASLEGLASVSVRERQLSAAARLFGAAAALRTAIDAPTPPSERSRLAEDVAVVRSELGDDVFTSAWAEGEALPLNEAIAYAQEEARSCLPSAAHSQACLQCT